MRLLITAGPTREPIDPVRYIGNRSSGRMGAALAQAAVAAGHAVTLVVGPVVVPMPAAARRVDVETAEQMCDAVLGHWPSHDLLIMAAAVADYRPASILPNKLARDSRMQLELVATPDITAAAAQQRRPDQRIVAFSLVGESEMERSQRKLEQKKIDLLVHNPLKTMNSALVEATLLWPDGRREAIGSRSKGDFADTLLQRALALFGSI